MDEMVTEEQIDDLVEWAARQAAAGPTEVWSAPERVGLHDTARVVLELVKRADRRAGVDADGYGLVLPQQFIEDRMRVVATLAVELGLWGLEERRAAALSGVTGVPREAGTAQAVAEGLFDKIARTASAEPF